MRAPLLARAAVIGVVVGAVVSGSSCGIFDGLFWPLEVGDSEICNAVASQNAQVAACRGGGEGEGEGEGDGSKVVTDHQCEVACFGAHRNGCDKEWQAALECLLDTRTHQCSELAADAETFCDDAFRTFASCAGFTDENGVSTGNSACSGPNNGGNCIIDGVCSGDEDPTCPDCSRNCSACFGGQCSNTCDNGEPSECPDCNSGDPCSTECIGGCNGQCEGGEGPSCPDCSTAACGGCLGAHCDGVCNAGEDPSCPDCNGSSGCNHDSVCGAGESDVSCHDDCNTNSTVCNQNGVCDLGENNVACPSECVDPCKHDGVCRTADGETPQCSDCASTANCTPCNGAICDGTCQSGEELTSCPDCAAATCAVDGDCGAANQICDKFGKSLCDVGDQNCLPEDSTQTVCRDRCTSSSGCPITASCVFAPPNGQRGVCEVDRCHLTGECTGGRSCAKSYELTERDGFCLVSCDPNTCFFGGGCACDPTPTGRCAPVHDAATVTGFVCTFPGSAGPNAPCAVEGDCNGGLTCAGGFCRQFCTPVGNSCGGGTCQPFSGSVGVCLP